MEGITKHTTTILAIMMLLMITTTTTFATLTPTFKHPKEHHLWHGYELPPEPHKGFYKYIEKCLSVFTDKCGEHMFAYIFYKRVEIGYGCCHQLVKMGEECNEALSDVLENIKQFKGLKLNINSRTKQAWHHCSRIDKCVAKGGKSE